MDNEPIRILLVEDDEDDYIMTRDLLAEIEGADYELKWATSYEEALEIFKTEIHDVYLFDYRIGRNTGIELLKEFTQKGCTAPVILMTGQGDKEVDIEAMQSGASDYLIKGHIDAHPLERSIRYAIKQKKAEEQTLQMAYYDGLTGLPNRSLFSDRLQQTIKLAGRHQRISAVLFLDLDNFKRINDTFGHRLGDLLLKEVADRLPESVRLSDSIARSGKKKFNDTIARLGGDEFTILLTEISHIEDAAKVAHRILGTLSKPFIIDSHEIFITASIGIAVYPLDGKDIDTLLKNADSAMYHAKEQGKNNCQFYRQSMNADALESFILENNLRSALERDEFLLHYQPKVEISTGKIVGLEALVRWHHPEMGMVYPAQFIPLAEETGLIIPIGEWVLQAACKQNRAWQAEGFKQVPIAVNLSCRQFSQKNLPETIAAAMRNAGMSPDYLHLEVTESILMQNTEATIDTLNKLTSMGLKLLIDDFGTGYSSLNYLRRFPFYAIKIDRSFVKEIKTNPDDEAIVRAIIAMAHSLNLKVIAEEVETQHQLSFLNKLRCDEMQGYLVSRPLPAGEVPMFLPKEKTLSGSIPASITVEGRGADVKK